MKKNIFIFLIVLLFLPFLGCSKDNTTTEAESLDRLNTPTNIVVEGVMVSWDDVEGASDYDIYLNEDSFNTTSSYYMIDKEGSFDIKVIAKGKGYFNSLPSEILTTTIAYENNVTYNLNIIDDYIFWEDITDASEYKVYINGEIYTTTDANLNLKNIDDGFLIINIQAIYPIGAANISDNELVEHNLVSVRDRDFQYSINSTQNIYIMDLDTEEEVIIINEDGELLNNNVLVKNNYYEIKSDYIISLQDCEIVFYLYYGNIKSKIHITMSEKSVPYIISSTIVYTNGEEDVSLQFELFTGDFRQVSGTGLETEDYNIENNILTIKASYIDSRFQTSDNFSINYALETDEIAVGLVVFNKETE
ncbi:MAG: hypothetical protein K9L64_06470 [Candidatus Izimaplasma sp.]|nr:hypothetical protein [Candidatus Izimaplasma bacterium]